MLVMFYVVGPPCGGLIQVFLRVFSIFDTAQGFNLRAFPLSCPPKTGLKHIGSKFYLYPLF